jgi:hypothetical protein
MIDCAGIALTSLRRQASVENVTAGYRTVVLLPISNSRPAL